MNSPYLFIEGFFKLASLLFSGLARPITTTLPSVTTSKKTPLKSDFIFDAISPQKYDSMPTNLAATAGTTAEISSEIDRYEQYQTCPAHCSCTCAQVTVGGDSSAGKKVDLDISLLPCARTAAYQLDLAIKLCKRK